VFLGGVVRRHPTLNFGFMEGGVSWACQMCGDLIEHWEKRRGPDCRSRGDRYRRAAAADRALRRSRLKAHADAIMQNLDAFRPECSLEELSRSRARLGRFRSGGRQLEGRRARRLLRQLLLRLRGGRPCHRDGVRSPHGRPAAAGLQLDFTHFDVPDFKDVIPEAFEAVERGYMTEQDFREFTFTNAASLHTRNNPGFLQGHVVEQEWRGSLA
jgi:hypothetical protein